ncbi:TetR/AcrR family transcriptional regulator [Plastoroseomonas arctica]|uniref:TetR/AcrR family transcriptional regulator n=1 Tax=Plastoroseomonas arctica TaxID=1509237 RepID=A0AAF1K6C6_9PROT|nr:TetR family transcriptional regulator [Plastoroseomonas arctica]MBR0657230.1 TetR/AcrR family transcriptional regulator [Plastoroseomonas arctica]
MRVSKQQAAANRERILDEAARLFRERGLAGVGVDALAAAAGMTHGSLYSQFGSKERLAGEAMRHALAGSAARSDQAADLQAYAESYLSTRHRDAPGSGCVLATLAAEAARQDGAVRESVTAGVRRMASRIAGLLAKRRAGDEAAALGVAATMVGAMVLARAVDDPALSEQILAAGRAAVAQRAAD